jgi:hypothetical protein
MAGNLPGRLSQVRVSRKGVLAGVALVATIAFALSAAAQGALPQPIYFFQSTINTVTKQNPLVVRPAGFDMLEDGSWDLQGLHWTRWGTRVADAVGVSSASDDIPNAAAGKRTDAAAQVTLSRPGRFQGHEVYRCFQLTIPSHPTSDQHVCLRRIASTWGFGPATATPSKASADFLVPAVAASCAMHDSDSASASAGALVYCQTLSPQRSVQMTLNGQLKMCTGASATTNICDLGNPGLGTPKLGVGKQVTVGRFRCRSARASLTCTVIKTGKGFRIDSSGITPIAGATATTAVFYSPDQKVSCEMADPNTNGYYVYCNASGLHAASLGPDGQAGICNSGCLGMEPQGTPALGYGKQITVGRFRCSSAAGGITCIVIETRRGFLINATTVIPIGPQG